MTSGEDAETLHQEVRQLRGLVATAAEGERRRILSIVRGIGGHYPSDIFPVIMKHEEHPSRDRVAAQMARHICQLIEQKVLGEAEDVDEDPTNPGGKP